MSQTNVIRFDYNTYPNQLEGVDKLNIPEFKSQDKGKDAWQYHGSKSSKYNQVIEFEFQDQVKGSDDPLNYRAWYMETSVVGQNAGLLVSAKLDYIRGSKKDFHLFLLCGFDGTGKLLVAQASAQFISSKGPNFHIQPITSATAANGDVAQAMYEALLHEQKAVDYGDTRDNAGAKGFAYIAKANITSFAAAVRSAE